MTPHPTASEEEIDRDWAALGLPFAEASLPCPDLERLLLGTARVYDLQYEGKVRLISAWIARFGTAIARHRLGSIVLAQPDAAKLTPRVDRVLAYAEALGASVELRTTVGHLLGVKRPPGRRSRSLEAFESFNQVPGLRHDADFAAHLRRHQQWDQTQDPWGGQVPPARWLVDHHPEYLDRVVRKGDLRVSVIETLRRDLPNAVASSESALTRRLAANRGGVRAAIDALVLEGRVVLERRSGNERDCQVRLVGAASPIVGHSRSRRLPL